MRNAERRKVNVLVMKCLRSLMEGPRMDSSELTGVSKIWNRMGVGEVSRPESIEMTWIEWTGTILLAGVHSRSKWSAGTG